MSIYLSHHLFLIYIYIYICKTLLGQKSEQRSTTAVASSASRDRVGDDAAVRGGGVLDLQYSAFGLEHLRNIHRGSTILDCADRQSARDHQQ